MSIDHSHKAQNLSAEFDKIFAELQALFHAKEIHEFTHEDTLKHIKLIRKIAIISSTLHNEPLNKLSSDEREWIDSV